MDENEQMERLRLLREREMERVRQARQAFKVADDIEGLGSYAEDAPEIHLAMQAQPAEEEIESGEIQTEADGS